MRKSQAKHSPLCALGRAWTPFDQAEDGCTCPQGPIYYVVVREGDQAHKEVVGRDRQQAELALLRIEDSSTRASTARNSIWASRTGPGAGSSRLSGSHRPSARTDRRSSTLKKVFGGQRVRRIGPEDIARFNSILRERGCSRVHSRQAPARPGRVLAGGRLLSVCRVEPGSGVAAGAEAPTGAKGGGVLRERRTTSPLPPPPGRALPVVVPGRAQDRHAARRAVRTSLVRRRSRAGGRARSSESHGRHARDAEEPRAS